MTDRTPKLPDFDDFDWGQGESEWDSSPPEWLNQIPPAEEAVPLLGRGCPDHASA